jgi:hypothetical protein
MHNNQKLTLPASGHIPGVRPVTPHLCPPWETTGCSQDGWATDTLHRHAIITQLPAGDLMRSFLHAKCR